MKTLTILAVVVGILVVVVGLFSYLALPGLIESRIATNLRERYELEQKPEVEVSSGFPPELLVGRIDRIKVRIDQLRREGILLRDVRMYLEEVDISVPSLWQGELEREIEAASLVAEAPEEAINDYLRENDLGLGDGEIEIAPQEIVYRSSGALFGVPASVGLDLRVAGPRTIEVIPQEATVGGLALPNFLTESLASGGRTLTLSELPLRTELVSVEPSSDDALVVRAKR